MQSPVALNKLFRFFLMITSSVLKAILIYDKYDVQKLKLHSGKLT